MIKSSLIEHSDVKFELIYGNKTRNSTMFLDELKYIEESDIKDLIFIGFILKKEYDLFLIQELIRIICNNLLNMFPSMKNADVILLCGPGGLIDNSKEFLLLNKVKESKIYFERFNVDTNSSDSNSNQMK